MYFIWTNRIFLTVLSDPFVQLKKDFIQAEPRPFPQFDLSIKYDQIKL